MDVQQYRLILHGAFEKADTALDTAVEKWLTTTSREDVGHLMQVCTPKMSGQYQPLPQYFTEILPDIIDLQYVKTAFDGLTGHALDFYQRYTSHIFLMLGLYSLPYCYQSADGAKVLIHSQRLKDQPVKRLEETSAFVKQIFDATSDQNIEALIDINYRIRLIHTVSRVFAKRHLAFVPINQAELLGTSFAFGSLVLRALRKIDIAVGNDVADDWLRLFNLTAYLQGVDQDLLPKTTKQVWIAEQIIAAKVFKSSAEGRVLAMALFKALDQQLDAPIAISTLAGHLLGKVSGSIIGIEKHTSVSPLVYRTLAKVLELKYQMR